MAIAVNRSTSSLIDRAVGACMAVLVAATALFIAVRLIEAVLTALLVIVGVAAFLAITYGVLRSRNRGW